MVYMHEGAGAFAEEIEKKERPDYRSIFQPLVGGHYVSEATYPPTERAQTPATEVAELVRAPDYHAVFGTTAEPTPGRK